MLSLHKVHFRIVPPLTGSLLDSLRAHNYRVSSVSHSNLVNSGARPCFDNRSGVRAPAVPAWLVADIARMGKKRRGKRKLQKNVCKIWGQEADERKQEQKLTEEGKHPRLQRAHSNF